MRGVTIEDCVELARRWVKKSQTNLTFRYIFMKKRNSEERRNLANIRRGDYEGLKQTISLPERHPDFGKPVMHPTAGATVIGARNFLVAYNINLSTSDVSIAKK